MRVPPPFDERDPRVCRRFVELAREALESHPEIQHRWLIDADEDHAILEIAGQGSPGFDINVEIYSSEIIISAEGFHEHYPVSEPLDDFLRGVLGLVRDMLSPGMRIAEMLSDGSPYRWRMEVLDKGQWIPESTCGLFFWNWFGRRSEKIYSNTNLPSRPQMLEEME